jgi:purine nucleosidase
MQPRAPVRRILLDSDLAMGVPGSNVDDGFALAVALADPDIEVECITTVAGNSDVVTATRLTRQLLELVGRTDVPVHQGAGQPITPSWQGTPSSGSAADELARRVMAEPGSLTLVTIGPLTNVALALMVEPEFARAVQEIVVMGGAFFEHTNVAAMPGERNFWSDPAAAEAVLSSGAAIRLVGLDVTRRVRLTHADTAGMAAAAGVGKTFAPFAARCADEWIAYQQRARGIPESDGCAMHDPLAVAVVSHPDLVTWTPAHVAVETTSAVTRGIAVADLLRQEQSPPANCQIATDVDSDAFREYFFKQIARLP